jgi:hypothetical protein
VFKGGYGECQANVRFNSMTQVEPPVPKLITLTFAVPSHQNYYGLSLIPVAICMYFPPPRFLSGTTSHTWMLVIGILTIALRTEGISDVMHAVHISVRSDISPSPEGSAWV